MPTLPFRFLILLLPGSLCLLLGGCAEQISMRPGAFSTVVIDAGHGGHDSGERSRYGLVEKTLTLDTAQRLQPILREAGFRTVMVRDGDYFVELDDRVAKANQYADAILVSIHYNASPSSGPSGEEIFFWRTDSHGLAVRVSRHLASGTGLDYRGVTRRVLRLTHNPRVPSILCECGFLTNGSDASRVASASFRQDVAESLAEGIIEQHERGDVGIGALPRMAQSQPRHRTVVSSSHASRHRGRISHPTSHRRGHSTPPTHRRKRQR